MYNPKTIEVFCFLLAVSLIVKFFFKACSDSVWSQRFIVHFCSGHTWRAALSAGYVRQHGQIGVYWTHFTSQCLFVCFCFLFCLSFFSFVVCSPPATHMLIIYLENSSVSALYFLYSVFLSTDQSDGRSYCLQLFHQQQPQIFFYNHLSITGVGVSST